jgi:hypothetical protein
LVLSVFTIIGLGAKSKAVAYNYDPNIQMVAKSSANAGYTDIYIYTWSGPGGLYLFTVVVTPKGVAVTRLN